jgi:hypothetical protein
LGRRHPRMAHAVDEMGRPGGILVG